MQKSLSIFIIGTTAVGKTKLSIQLSKALNGQVINSDSKQLYKHANIMTAKASQQQQQNIPHHMLDCLELKEISFNRNKYYAMARQCINFIRDQKNKIPIIVGGTNYYVETLLYDISMKENQSDKNEGIGKDNTQQKQQKVQMKSLNGCNKQQQQLIFSPKKFTKEQLQQLSLQQKYNLLKEVDPKMARKVHPNDQIRITSFLIRYSQTNTPPSASYKPYSHTLRNNDTILFWLRNSNKEELHEMMSQRIVKMLKEGGLKQIITVFQYANVHGISDMGALQSIGYKQFQPFYEKAIKGLFTQQEMKETEFTKIFDIVESKINQIKWYLDKYIQTIDANKKNKQAQEQEQELVNQEEGEKIKILENSIKLLEKNTLQYSKRQLVWIRNRIFSQANQQNRKHFFVLELSGMGNIHQRFDKQIKAKALEIIKTISEGGFGSIQQQQKYFSQNKHESIQQWQKYYCEKCQIEANGKNQWDIHLQTRKHRGYTKKQRKQQIKLQKKQKKQKQQQQKQEQQQLQQVIQQKRSENKNNKQ